MIDPVSLSAENQAQAWLAQIDVEREVLAAGAIVNRVLQSHRVAAADPYVHEVTPGQALVIRAGYGAGEQVADGNWLDARELSWHAAGRTGRGRRDRSATLRPQERLAALLGGRHAMLLCEELTLRARLDLDQGRHAHAAIGLRDAYAAALRELGSEDRHDLAIRVAELDKLRALVDAQADAALAAAGADAGDSRSSGRSTGSGRSAGSGGERREREGSGSGSGSGEDAQDRRRRARTRARAPGGCAARAHGAGDIVSARMDPTITAIGTWSGGRFMHFGEALDDEHLIALLAPGDGVDTVLTADVYGEGEADRLLGRALAGRDREGYCLVGAVGHDFYEGERDGPRGFPRFTDPRLRGPGDYGAYLRMATERSLERCGVDRFDLLLLHNPDRTGYRSDEVWEGMAALREAGLTRLVGVAPGPANGFTLDLIDCLERFTAP